MVHWKDNDDTVEEEYNTSDIERTLNAEGAIIDQLIGLHSHVTAEVTDGTNLPLPYRVGCHFVISHLLRLVRIRSDW